MPKTSSAVVDREEFEYYRFTPITRLMNWIESLFCSHRYYNIKTYRMVKSNRSQDKDTTKEYQRIKLPPNEHYLECAKCFKNIGRLEIYDDGCK